MCDQTMKKSLLRDYPIPSKSLLFQCPLCKELTRLESFTTVADGFVGHCSECSELFAYRSTVQTLMALQSKASPKGKRKAKALEVKGPATPSLRGSSESSAESDRWARWSEDSQGSLSDATEGSKEALQASPSSPDMQKSDVAKKSAKTARRPVLEGGQHCPKCNKRCAESLKSCPHCGLAFANIGLTFVPSSPESAGTPQEKAAWGLWQEIESDWDNDGLHDRFVQYCVSNELFDLVVARYREVRDEASERSPKAEIQMGSVVEHVQRNFLLFQQKEESLSSKTNSWKFFLSLLLLSFGLLMLFLFWRQSVVPQGF